MKVDILVPNLRKLQQSLYTICSYGQFLNMSFNVLINKIWVTKRIGSIYNTHCDKISRWFNLSRELS